MKCKSALLSLLFSLTLCLPLAAAKDRDFVSEPIVVRCLADSESTESGLNTCRIIVKSTSFGKTGLGFWAVQIIVFEEMMFGVVITHGKPAESLSIRVVGGDEFGVGECALQKKHSAPDSLYYICGEHNFPSLIMQSIMDNASGVVFRVTYADGSEDIAFHNMKQIVENYWLYLECSENRRMKFCLND